MHLPKFITLLFVTSFFASSSYAYIYEASFKNLGKDYLKRLSRISTDEMNPQCEKRYQRILSDGVLDIRILLGYFDWTTGENVRYGGRNYGYSPSIDLGAYEALKDLLRSRCKGNAEFCGFSQDSNYQFSKTVRIDRRNYTARIQMSFASVSEYLEYNTGRYSSQQQQRSEALQAAFNNALRNADAVFYFGHSRDGGGPDFNPPVFSRGKNKVNYNGYYKVQRPGYKKMISALSSGRAPAILGLMSCDSKDHFLRGIRKVAPNMGVISSKDVLKVDGVYTAMIGGVDAVLRGQCQRGFSTSIRLTSFNQQYITMDGMF